MKNKITAGLLALFFGAFGTHRFYLGQRFVGIVYFFAFCFSMLITIEEGTPLILFPALVAFLDAIIFFAMPQRDFDKRYNKDALEEQNNFHISPAPTATPNKKATIPTSQRLKKEGIAAYRNDDPFNAIYYFTKAVELSPNDISLHFNLACCHSLEKDENLAIYHLEQAITNGFDDFDKIASHNALTWLRKQSSFEQLMNKDSAPSQPSPPENISTPNPLEEITSNQEPATEDSEDLLEQIMRLGELKELGLLSEEEFIKQKEKLLDE